MSAETPTGVATAATYADEFTRDEFLVQQIAGRMATVTICKVVAVGEGNNTLAKVGYVDIQPQVQQMTGAGLALPHGIIHNVPFLRLQGGKNAIVIDPQVGDLGIALFCSHDISKVKNTRAEGLPGSRRRFDWGDALYLGGILNGAPEQYIWFDSAGDIRMKPKTKVYIDGALDVTGEVTGNGIPLSTHRHGGVDTGSGTSGGPEA
jgi:hypothetical protein